MYSYNMSKSTSRPNDRRLNNYRNKHSKSSNLHRVTHNIKYRTKITPRFVQPPKLPDDCQFDSGSAEMNKVIRQFYQSENITPVRGFQTHVCTNQCRFWSYPHEPMLSVCRLSHRVHKCSPACLVEDGETSVCKITSHVVHTRREVYHTNITTEGKHESTINAITSYTPKNNLSVTNIISIIHGYMEYCDLEPVHSGKLQRVALQIQTQLLKMKGCNSATIPPRTLTFWLLMLQGLTCKLTGTIIIEKTHSLCSEKDIAIMVDKFRYEKVYNKIVLSLYNIFDDGNNLMVVPASSQIISCNTNG